MPCALSTSPETATPSRWTPGPPSARAIRVTASTTAATDGSASGSVTTSSTWARRSVRTPTTSSCVTFTPSTCSRSATSASGTRGRPRPAGACGASSRTCPEAISGLRAFVTAPGVRPERSVSLGTRQAVVGDEQGEQAGGTGGDRDVRSGHEAGR
ncbi:hypothetical protein GCM10025868_27140 [Angustibacter aerolatus]|uniref:Uncharacterized protein n=1 Tax=Angustibacter aerolatus TaxID=1162965 RepID=A0ABQ6JI02_9ACTN|nr:hypothetical protein GCM10025868_27140 [Angustibacter aerolatus]